MRLYDFLAGLNKEQVKSFAKAAGTTPGYLELLKGQHRQASSDLCKKIEVASKYQVTRIDLRPDFFADLAQVNAQITQAAKRAA